MPMCGFDKKMLDGLDDFHQGLVEAVQKKSKKNNITIKEAKNSKEIMEFIETRNILTVNKVQVLEELNKELNNWLTK